MDLSKRTENTIKNSFVGILAQALMVISSFVCRMIFVRCLREEYLGVSGLFSNIISMLSLAELGIGSAIIYELYHALAYKNDKEIRSLMTFYKKAYTVIGIFIGIAGMIFLPFLTYFVELDSNIHENVYILYLLYLLNTVLSYFFSYKSAIIDAAQCNYITSIVYTIIIVIQNIIQCVILVLFTNFLLYLIIQVTCTALYNILISFIADKMFPVIKERGEKLEKEQLEKEQQHRMFKNVRDLFITNVSSILVNATDNLIITAISGLATTGLNSNYSLMSQTLTGFTTRIQNGVCASIGNVVAVEDDKHKLELFDEIFFGFFWMYFWCALCYSLLINDVIKICFGAKYVMPFSIAVITGVNLYTLEMKSAIGIFKGTMGLFKYGKYTVFATGVINIIFSIILGKKWGVFGVLLATFVANMLTVKWYFPYVTFKYGFHTSAMHYFKRDIRYWIEVIIFSCATHYICEAITLPIWLDLIYRAIICIIVPNMLIILFHRREREYNELINRLNRSLRNYMCKIKRQ